MASISVMSGSSSPHTLELGDFRVSEVMFPPLLELPRHSHARACFAVVLGGSVRKAFRGSTHELIAPGTVTMPAEEQHEDRFERAGAHILVVEPAPEAVRRIGPLEALFQEVHVFGNPGLSGLAWRIRSELRAPDAVTSLAVDGLLLELLAMASRELATIRSGGLRPNWLARVEDLLRAHFTDPLDVATLAAEAKVHPAHLAKVFRRWHGMALGDYVRRLRLDWAARQLAMSELPLSEVALQAGFADQSHFTRRFKRHTGLSPGQYRRETRRR
jgi:AraC family transcriptional regulator